MTKTIILILAGGTTSAFSTDEMPRHKAMLPIHGRPMIEYVIHAAQGSNAEAIYIIQDDGQDLETNIQSIEGCTFINRPPSRSNIGDGLLLGLEEIVKRLDQNQILDSQVLVLPCDLVLVTSDHINLFLSQVGKNKSPGYPTVHDAERVQKRFPHKGLRVVYGDDIRKRYAWQFPFVVSGKVMEFLLPDNTSWEHKFLYGIRDDINRARGFPHWESFVFIYTAFKYFRFKYLGLLIKPMIEVIQQRVKLSTIKEVLEIYFQIEFQFIETMTVEFSGDIDTPMDYLDVLGIPWEQA